MMFNIEDRIPESKINDINLKISKMITPRRNKYSHLMRFFLDPKNPNIPRMTLKKPQKGLFRKRYDTPIISNIKQHKVTTET